MEGPSCTGARPGPKMTVMYLPQAATTHVQWRLLGGSRLYDGRLPALTTRHLRAESLEGVLPARGDRLMLPVAGFPDPIPFKCTGVSTGVDPHVGPVMCIGLEIA